MSFWIVIAVTALALIIGLWGIAARIVFIVKMAEVFWPIRRAPWWWQAICFYAEFPSIVVDAIDSLNWRRRSELRKLDFAEAIARAAR